MRDAKVGDTIPYMGMIFTVVGVVAQEGDELTIKIKKRDEEYEPAGAYKRAREARSRADELRTAHLHDHAGGLESCSEDCPAWEHLAEAYPT